MLATCVYLACKTEECPQHIRTVVSEARGLWPGRSIIAYSRDRIAPEVDKLAECEFYLIEEMDACLVVHQPYSTFPLFTEFFTLSAQDGQIVWSVINDTYVTDLILLWPPHILAFAALLVGILTPTPQFSSTRNSSTNLPSKIIDFIAESGIDMDGVSDCVQSLISLYEIWQNYDSKRAKEILESSTLSVTFN